MNGLAMVLLLRQVSGYYLQTCWLLLAVSHSLQQQWFDKQFKGLPVCCCSLCTCMHLCSTELFACCLQRSVGGFMCEV
jgi:hypothetical protein